MVMMLRQCCCGCTLKTGTIIIGVLTILGGLGNLIGGITTAVRAADNFVDAESVQVFVGVGAVLAVLGAILLVFSVLLIIGAQNDRPSLLVPWMVYTIVFLITNTVLYIFEAAEYFSRYDNVNGAGNIVAAVIFVLLQTYFLLVVYSLYRELRGTAPPNYV
jgi:hypothetical protein